MLVYQGQSGILQGNPFGPESPRVWGPWPKDYATAETPFPKSGDQRAGNVLVLQSDKPCPTCRQGHCLRRSERKRNCDLMQTLDSEHVIEALADMLFPSAERREIAGGSDPGAE